MKKRHAHIPFVGTSSAVCEGRPTSFTERRKAKIEVVDIYRAVIDKGDKKAWASPIG
jgi:hypothetical protein